MQIEKGEKRIRSASADVGPTKNIFAWPINNLMIRLYHSIKVKAIYFLTLTTFSNRFFEGIHLFVILIIGKLMGLVTCA